MEVGYKERVWRDDAPVSVNLKDVISKIRSDKYKVLAEKIRKSDKETRTRLKREHLPVFFPSMVGGEPTTVVQIDIDPNEDVEIDFAEIKRQVIQLKHCLHAFDSPSGGLKFAILCDLDFSTCELKELRAGKFKVAWDQTVEFLKQKITVPFDADRSTRSHTQSCYLSFDQSCYYNPDAQPLSINDQCVVELPKEYKSGVGEHPIEFLLELLKVIPHDLTYGERLPLNFSAMHVFGSDGLYAMQNHWISDDPVKISRQLNDQYKGMRYGHIGTLVNCAKKYGYKPTTGRARKNLAPKPTTLKLGPMTSKEDASAQLKNEIERFFREKMNTFINVSTGAGKTDAVLNYIVRQLPTGTKVLYLVPTHELGSEVIERLNKIRLDEIRLRGRRDGLLGQAVQIQGRSRICENRTIRQKFDDQGADIVGEICWKGCHYQNECTYTAQFWDLNPFAFIRVMTHRDWSNEPSAWSNGCQFDQHGNVSPRNGKWIPDFIVIDENILSLTESAFAVKNNLSGNAIKAVLGKVFSGKSYTEAILESADKLREDKRVFKNNPKAPFASVDQYLRDMKANSRAHFETIVIDHLLSFVETRDETLLQQIFINESGIAIKKISGSNGLYRNVPTLFLDATADETFTTSVLGDIKFRQIAVQPKEDIRVFKLCDATVTKRSLEKPEAVETLIRGLRRIVSRYQLVGLISYLNVDGYGDFSTFLGEQIGATEIGHFGAVRGLNAFEDVDCLLIVGRHLIHQDVVQEIAKVGFGITDEVEAEYADVVVRMHDGAAMTVNAMTSVHPIHRSINNQFSVSETIQAIGRGRLVHGSKKDVYIFANESIGTDVAITGFFKWGDYFWRAFISEKRLNNLSELGCVRSVERELVDALGITKDVLKKNKDEIFFELKEAGYLPYRVACKDRHGKKVEWNFFVSDINKLQGRLATDGATDINVSEIKY